MTSLRSWPSVCLCGSLERLKVHMEFLFKARFSLFCQTCQCVSLAHTEGVSNAVKVLLVLGMSSSGNDTASKAIGTQLRF